MEGNAQERNTYLLTPWSRVLLEKPTGFATNQEIFRILWNPKVHYRAHKRPPPVPAVQVLGIENLAALGLPYYLLRKLPQVENGTQTEIGFCRYDLI